MKLLTGNRIKNSRFLSSLLPSYVPWKPLSCTISITTRCNLKCIMCSRSIYKVKNIDMSIDMFDKITDSFKNKSITILGAGEPLLHPYIHTVLGICFWKNIKVSLVTNGTLADHLVLTPNIQSIVFSIDGIYSNYDRIRIGSNFNTVINNLKLISGQRRNKYPELRVNFVGMQSNINDLPELIEIVGNFVDTIEVSHPIIFSPNTSIEHLNNNVIEASTIFAKSIDIAEEHKVKLILRELEPYSVRCIEPWAAPYIGVEGNIYPCCMIGGGDPQESVIEYYNDIPITRNITSFGNIADFNKIWNNDKFRNFRKVLSRVNYSQDKEDNYEEILKAPYTSYCKICPYRWNFAC